MTNTEELSVKLAYNLIDVSLDINEEKEKPHKKILADKETRALRKQIKRARYIVIVGAGASKAASEKIPTAKDVADILESRYLSQHKVIREIVENEQKRLYKVNALNPDDFETRLLALNRFFPDEIRKELKEIFHPELKYTTPNLFYEILAHMFKHRFIDVIINFNFDEILDQAIAEEMGEGEYHYIYSDGHCPEEAELMFNQRYKRPIYIKPHGTASHPSTLRFTRDDYYALPKEIELLIKKLVSGDTGLDDYKQIPVNLIVFGFAMGSFEFNEILEQKLPSTKDSRTDLYYFDRMELNLESNNLSKIINLKKLREHKNQTMDDWVLAFWSSIEKHFDKYYQPKGIDRHQLINSIFYSERDKNKADVVALKNYYHDRLLVEVALSALNNRGLISLEHVFRSRVGIYYNQLRKRDQTPISAFVKKLGFEHYRNAFKSIYIINKPNRFDFDEFVSYLFGKLYVELLDADRKIWFHSLRNNQNFETFKKHARQIYYSNRKNINPKFKNPHFELFDHLENDCIIDTNLLWSYRFRTLLERKDKWDILLTMSDHGNVLLNSKNSEEIGDKKIGLIMSTEVPPNQQLKKLRLIGDSPYQLPWWNHNSHLVLFLKEKKTDQVNSWKDKWTLYRGIFFTSRFTNRVTPVYVRQEEDLEVMLNIFGKYLFRAQKFKESNFKTLPVIESGDQIEACLTALAQQS